MRRKETQKISDILKDFVKRPVYEQKIQETMLVSNWGKVLGPGIARSTSELYIKNKTLFVRIESPVVRHELFMMRSRIIEALNKSVGSNVIGNIHFS
jgi:predicted nucleic acid-binding Zn ribbon protein